MSELDKIGSSLTSLRLSPSEARIPRSPSSPRPPRSPSCSPRPLSLTLPLLPERLSEPDEHEARWNKMQECAGVLAVVRPRLLLGDAQGAASATLLTEAGVTHVLNAAAFVCANVFEEEGTPPALERTAAPRLLYRSLWLQDSPAEDLLCVLYDGLDFIREALAGGGTVLVHCSAGVSRSAALLCGYLMWSERLSFDAAFEAVKAARAVASPNIGFSCQLLQWGRRISSFSSPHPRLYRAQAHSQADPRYIVFSHVQRGHSWLRASKALVLHSPASVWAWRAADCLPQYWEAALRFAAQLSRYEDAASPATEVVAGEEVRAEGFLAALDVAGADEEAAARASEDVAAAMPAELRRFALGERSRDACRAGVGAQETAAVGFSAHRRCSAPFQSDDDAAPPPPFARTVSNRF